MLGDTVQYVSLPFVAAEEVPAETEKVKAFFDILSDSANYPIAFHCKIGTDRTGSLTYLLLALLGVSEDDIYTDFVFSNTGSIGNARAYNRINDYTEGYVNGTDGDTIQEKCRNYLLGIGITAEQISNICSIMLGE